MNCQVTTPGKLILIGEYAVLEGAPALVMAVNRYARVSLIPRRGSHFTVHSTTLDTGKVSFRVTSRRKLAFPPKVTDSQIEKLRFFRNILEDFFLIEKLSTDIPSHEIVLNTREFFLPKEPQKLGLGSSAALTVALVQGILYILNQKDIRITDPDQLFRLSEKIHYRAQGKKGSGIDIASSCFGGTILFQKLFNREPYSFKINKIEIPEELLIIPIWTGISASTPNLIKQVHEFQKKNQPAYDSIYNNLSQISQQACDALKGKNTLKFLDYCRQYFDTLTELGEASQANIVSPVHRKIAGIVYNEGAVYKSSGAGGGDIGLAFTLSKEVAKRVSDKLLRSGFEILNIGLSLTGSCVKSRFISKKGE
ncbi:MAG: hypothetical protein JSW33_07715 [bacterium]|nr:MAG: hypothetical protein JSW33_07715 [bacterium]